jgi:hypothetical protein
MAFHEKAGILFPGPPALGKRSREFAMEPGATRQHRHILSWREGLTVSRTPDTLQGHSVARALRRRELRGGDSSLLVQMRLVEDEAFGDA